MDHAAKRHTPVDHFASLCIDDVIVFKATNVIHMQHICPKSCRLAFLESLGLLCCISRHNGSNGPPNDMGKTFVGLDCIRLLSTTKYEQLPIASYSTNASISCTTHLKISTIQSSAPSLGEPAAVIELNVQLIDILAEICCGWLNWVFTPL